MSHVVEIATKVKDLTALEAAVKECGGELVRNVSTYKWWGTHEGDYPLPEGVSVDELGKCDHVIRFKDCEWEVGVAKKGDAYRLRFDFFGHRGQMLMRHVGENCGKLTQLYAVQKATLEARKRGHTVRRVQCSDGSIKLAIGGVR